jgi:non-homologous end joining protein Ku
MLEAKLTGQEIAKPEPVAETPVVDLMEALKASVAAAQGQKAAKTDGTKKAAARTPKAAAGRKSA